MIRELLGSLMLPTLDWIQVEVSSYCNAACVYCPRTIYKDVWVNRHMSLELFKRLLPSFAKTDLIFLQGWGEPLLNPDFMAMVRIAKKAGCRVGTSTNGMLLDSPTADRLAEYGVDVVAFSVAGVDQKNDTIRKGTSLKSVLEAVGALDRARAGAGKGLPKIHIAYMLLRSGLQGVVKLPEALWGLGVSQIVISTLDFVPCEELESEAIIPSTFEEYSELRARLEAVREEGRRLGMEIHCQIYRPKARRPTCTENIQRALFVSSDGTVSPCVFGNLPVQGGEQLYCGAGRHYQPLNFGNVGHTPLMSIWRGKAYSSFRDAFNGTKLPALCEGCPKLFIG